MSCKNRFLSGSAEISGIVFSICGNSFANCIPVARPVCVSISSTNATAQDLSEISATFVKSLLQQEKKTKKWLQGYNKNDASFLLALSSKAETRHGFI